MDDVAPPPPDVAEQVVVARPPHVVWAAIADPVRMSTWSPEVARVTTSTSPPLPVGARFAGLNDRGRRRWSTSCRVVESVPGRAFAFDVSFLGLAVSRWRYVLQSSADRPQDRCTVEEQWWDRRGRLMGVLSAMGTGVRDRAVHNRATMRETLEALRVDLEST